MFFTNVLVLEDPGGADASLREQVWRQLNECWNTHVVFPFFPVAAHDHQRIWGDQRIWSSFWPKDERIDNAVAALSGPNVTVVAISPAKAELYHTALAVVADILRARELDWKFRPPSVLVIFKNQAGAIVIPAPRLGSAQDLTEFVADILRVLDDPTSDVEALVTQLRKIKLVETIRRIAAPALEKLIPTLFGTLGRWLGIKAPALNVPPHES